MNSETLNLVCVDKSCPTQAHLSSFESPKINWSDHFEKDGKKNEWKEPKNLSTRFGISKLLLADWQLKFILRRKCGALKLICFDLVSAVSCH